ncbi:MAG: TolC family protein [Bacteroidia bacterium]
MENLFFPEKMKTNNKNKGKGKREKGKGNLHLASSIILSTFFFFLFSFQTSAQTVTLDSVLNTIEKNNPMLKMYDEQIRSAKDYSEMAKSWMPPKVSTGPWQTPYNDFKGGMWMFTGEQMFPNSAKQNANYKFMNGMSAVESREKGVQKNQLISSAKQNFYEWIILKKKSEILIQTDSLLSYMIGVAEVRYTYNKEKLSNIYKAQADLYELRNMELMLDGDMKMKNVELNTLMNIDKNLVLNFDTSVSIKNYELQTPDTALISATRSDVKLFDEKINLIKLQQNFERSKRLPDFGISVTHMQTLSDMPGMPNLYSAMAMVTLPIVPWASKEYTSVIKSLNCKSNAVNYEKQSLLNETAGMISSLQAQIRSTKKQIANFQNNIVPTYYKSYQSSLRAYEENTENLFIVLDGLKMYLMSKINELDQLNILLKLQVNYEKELEIR